MSDGERSRALTVPDVRGEGPFPASEPEYQPPKEHLGLNPTNQYIPEPTPTAGPDRSVPDAPVAGNLEREPLPAPGEPPQQYARSLGAAWPPTEEVQEAAAARAADALKQQTERAGAGARKGSRAAARSTK